MAIFIGTSSNDSLKGGTGNDSISGLDGNDSLIVSGPNSTLDGGAGNDSLFLRSNNDSLSFFGGDGNDYLDGGFYSSSNSTLDGGAGDDTIAGIYANSGNLLRGGIGNDLYLLALSSTPGKATQIQDIGGTDRISSLDSSVPLLTNISLSPGKAGLARQGTSLLIDTTRDGIARAAEDLVILDFFGASSTVAGAGFIEIIDGVSGTQILAGNVSDATIAGGLNAVIGTPGNDNLALLN